MGVERIGGQPRSAESVSEQASVNRAGQTRKDAPPQGAERVRESDTLEISERARELARAQRAVETAPDVRAEQVAKIKQSVEDGTYSVSPDLIARKMLGVPEHE
jgi:negative regulator of flagellin synthesis FlgM